MVHDQKKEGGGIQNEPTDMLVRTATLERFYEVAKKLGTFSDDQVTCDDETLKALLTIDEQQQMVRKQLVAYLSPQVLEAKKERQIVPDEVDSETFQGRIVEAGEEAILDDLEDLEDEEEETLSPDALAEAERNDRHLNDLLDLSEQQPYAVHLYFYQEMVKLLEPLAYEFGTATSVETVKALIAAHRLK